MCDTRTLSSSNSVFISHCVGCRSIFLWHDNLIVGFTPEQFHSFRNLISNYEFEDGAVPFPDDAERVLVRLPSKDFSMAFTEEEWEVLREVVNEALYMHQVHELLE